MLEKFKLEERWNKKYLEYCKYKGFENNFDMMLRFDSKRYQGGKKGKIVRLKGIDVYTIRIDIDNYTKSVMIQMSYVCIE